MTLALEAPVAGDRSVRATVTVAVLVVVCGLAMLVSLGVGPAGLSPAEVFAALGARLGLGAAAAATHEVILFDIRLPRMAMGAEVGALLAIGGALMQGLCRNPLADPGIVGVSSGAAVGAVVAIVLGGGALAPLLGPLGTFALPLMAFFGGLIVTIILYRIATRRGQTSVATMILAGIGLAAVASAITGLFVYMSNDRQLRDLTFWMLGSLGGATWTKVLSVAPFLVATLLAIPFLGRGLNALVLGEAEAFHLGIRVQALKRLSILLVAATCGAAVAVSGVIGFVGILVPHVLRLVMGPDHRFLLPASVLAGSVLALAADMVARVIVAPAELPIGIVMAAVGGPFFLWLLLRRRMILDL